MTLFAAFNVLLSRYSGQDDILVGSPIAGRNRLELENLIGFFVNTLALRTDLSGRPTFRRLLARVRKICLGAYAHQGLPFEKLVEVLNPDRNRSHSPLFRVMFALGKDASEFVAFPGLDVTPLEIDSGTAKFDLTLFVCEQPDGLCATFEYSTELFDKATIERMASHLRTLLEGIVRDPDMEIGHLPLLTPHEKQQLLVEWSRTEVEYPRDACIHGLFEEQVERSPDAVAVVLEDQRLTYRELNQRANELAHLLQRRGVGPDVLVGICMERSLEMVTALLGILKAGGAYLPLDPSLPLERLDSCWRTRQFLSSSPRVHSRAGCRNPLQELSCWTRRRI